MNTKTRSKPLPLQKLEAATHRLHANFPRLAEIQHDVAILYKGYIGEQKVDYHLKLLPKSFTILPNVYLKANEQAFEMDFLIISLHAIYIVDAKNFDGKVTFDTILKQFIRSNADNETGFRYPITQVERQQLLLKNWLLDRNMIDLPVYYFIAISEPSTIINVTGDTDAIAKVVAHAEYIPKKIIDLDKVLSKNRRSNWNIFQIKNMILRESAEFDFDILSKWSIKEKDLVKGVICPGCREIGMKRVYSKWVCNRCNFQSKMAHLQAFSDYLLLINPSLTNKACMNFLNIGSRNLATRLLKSSRLTYNPQKRRWFP